MRLDPARLGLPHDFGLARRAEPNEYVASSVAEAEGIPPPQNAMPLSSGAEFLRAGCVLNCVAHRGVVSNQVRDFLCERWAERRGASARRQIGMPLKESEAIVLRTFPLGEGDRIVSFLDRAAGRLRGVAAGARRPKSRFGSTLETLSHILIWYFERETRELVRINQCELIDSFMLAQSDYSIANSLALISEVTEAVLPEREPAEPQFRLVLLAARAIKGHAPIPPVLAYFSGWTARLAGWFNFLGQCTKCGRSMDGEPGFAAVGSTGILCATCRQTWMNALSPGALSAGRQILTEKLERFLQEDNSTDALRDISDFALNVIEHHIEKKLVTRQGFEEVKER